MLDLPVQTERDREGGFNRGKSATNTESEQGRAECFSRVRHKHIHTHTRARTHNLAGVTFVAESEYRDSCGMGV